uniref:Matrin 3-like 1.1 n=1 Tax=Sparus aurata TaxID=8175 RepID=A0A671UB95_SPAAU
MSQKSQSDAQKHFAVGRGLLAAAETLNFSMNEQRSSRQMGGVSSSVGVGGGGGMEGQDGASQMSRRGGSNLGSTMKLFASLGLSPSDLDALAEIPEEDISVETLPHIIRQLKSRKEDTGERRLASSMSSEAAYRGGRDSWDDMPIGRMGGPSLGQGSARGQPSADFGFSSMQHVSSSRGYGLNCSSSGGGGRERPYSELSHHDSYSGLGMGPPTSDPVFMQRKMGSPSNGKIQDFLGVMPSMFPHVCSLCDFDVHSTMEWNQHLNGLQHAENRRLLLNMYPEWEPGMSSGRGRGLLDTPNLSAGLLGPAPLSSVQTSGGMSSSWGETLHALLFISSSACMRSRVVVVKYDRKPLSNKTLFAFTEPFGCLREHLVLKNKAFLEMNSHEEALDMVTYYEQHPAFLYSKPLTFYLSKRLLTDRSMDRPVKGQGSQVVFFSNLPREEEKKKELLTIAGRFGTVEKHLFLTDQAFVQLGTPEDAEMLVKYYSVNPLNIKGRPIRLNICTKYKTLKNRGVNITSSSSGSGARTFSSSLRTSSSKSSSGSRSREEKKKEEENKVKPEEEEEVSGVMEGEDRGEEVGKEQGDDRDAEGEEPERAESVKEMVEESEEVLQEEVRNMETYLLRCCCQGMRVINIVGFRRGYNFLNELLGLAKPFGKVVKHLVLDLRPEAYLQFETEEEARAMAKFYSSNITASVCGRPVRISHSMSYPTIQVNTPCGSSKVVYVGQIPTSKFSDDAILKLAEPFGRVKKYFTNRLKRECFIEMENAEEAEKMAEHCKGNPPKLSGKRLTIYVSRKYRQLKHGWVSSSVNSSTSPKPSKHSEEPPAKKPKEEEVEEEGGEEEKLKEEEEKKKEEEVQSSDVSGVDEKREEKTEKIPEDCDQNLKSLNTLTLCVCAGVEHVKMGYYCRVCFLFYSNEETAKKTHCSSQAHYDKLQVRLSSTHIVPQSSNFVKKS